MNLTDEQVDNLHRYLDESAPAIAAIGRLDKLSDSELADHVESLAMAMGEENEGELWHTFFSCVEERLRRANGGPWNHSTG